MTPEAFARRIAAWGRGTMLEAHGTRFISAGGGRAVAELDWRPDLAQPTGVFHAGAIVALADEAATAATLAETNPDAVLDPARFPLTLQLSVNLVRGERAGTLRAEAEIVHRGRTTFVVDVAVRSGDGRLVARLTATQLRPGTRPPGA